MGHQGSRGGPVRSSRLLFQALAARAHALSKGLHVRQAAHDGLRRLQIQRRQLVQGCSKLRLHAALDVLCVALRSLHLRLQPAQVGEEILS